MTLEEMIREMVKNGMTTEDIARETQDTLNSIEKVEKEKREKEKAKEEERKSHLRELEKNMRERLEKGNYCLCDVGTLAALVVAPDYPNWTVDDIKEFIEDVVGNLEMQAKLVGLDGRDCLEKIISIADRMYKPGTCSGCKQEKKKKDIKKHYDKLDDAFLDCVMDMLDSWSM